MGLCEECSWLEKVDDKPVCTHPSLFVNYTIEKMKCSHFLRLQNVQKIMEKREE